jgi:hypothetical protein
MPNSPGYVWEKMYVAIGCMCGRGSVNERLVNATISALMRLEGNDLPAGELQDDLKFVLKWTKENIAGDDGMTKLPDEIEHSKLVEKMLHILLETHSAP